MNRKRATALAAMALATGLVLPAAFPSLAEADTPAGMTTVSIPHFAHILLDPAHQHVFISSGTGYSTILVTDYSGRTVATVNNEPGADGLALSPDGSTVYAALQDGNAVSAINTGTLTETARFATGTGSAPQYLTYTAGRIWFSYGPASQGAIGSIDPSTSPATVALKTTTDYWNNPPELTSTAAGVLIAGEPQQTGELATYDVSTGSPRVLAPQTQLPSASVDDMAVTPNGSDLLLAGASSGYSRSAPAYSLPGLGSDGEYDNVGYSAPNSVTIAADGTVLTGNAGDGAEVDLFAPRDAVPLNYYGFPGGDSLLTDGLAVTPDGGTLFAVTGVGGNAGFASLNIIPNPEQTASTLTLSGPTSAMPTKPITVSGTLGGSTLGGPTPFGGGQALTVTRNGVPLPNVTTAADGSYSFTDTPPARTAAAGTVTYQVSYAGDAHLTAATASASVTFGD